MLQILGLIWSAMIRKSLITSTSSACRSTLRVAGAWGVHRSPAFFINGDVVDVSFGLQSLADAVERTSRRLLSKRPRVALGKVH